MNIVAGLVFFPFHHKKDRCLSEPFFIKDVREEGSKDKTMKAQEKPKNALKQAAQPTNIDW